MPNFSAIRTNSANDPTRIFCMTPYAGFDGESGGSQRSGNLLIEQTTHNERQHFVFTVYPPHQPAA
jgi:hypothetical protein